MMSICRNDDDPQKGDFSRLKPFLSMDPNPPTTAAQRLVEMVPDFSRDACSQSMSGHLDTESSMQSGQQTVHVSRHQYSTGSMTMLRMGTVLYRGHIVAPIRVLLRMGTVLYRCHIVAPIRVLI